MNQVGRPARSPEGTRPSESNGYFGYPAVGRLWSLGRFFRIALPARWRRESSSRLRAVQVGRVSWRGGAAGSVVVELFMHPIF